MGHHPLNTLSVILSRNPVILSRSEESILSLCLT